MTIIIVEGVDNTGKTTLVEDLLERYPLNYQPSIGNKHDVQQIDKQARDEAFHWEAKCYTLADRSRIISEYVYNPVLKRRPIAYGLNDWLEMLAGFTSQPHLIILCVRHTSKIIDEWDSREQLEGVRANLTTLTRRYEQVMGTLRLLFDLQETSYEYLVYDYEVVARQTVYGAVERYLDRIGAISERERLSRRGTPRG